MCLTRSAVLGLLLAAASSGAVAGVAPAPSTTGLGPTNVVAGDFGAPRVIVTEAYPGHRHLGWPKLVSDGGDNLAVGFVGAKEHFKGAGQTGVAVSSDGGRTFSAPVYQRDSNSRRCPHTANLVMGAAAGRFFLLNMAYDGGSESIVVGRTSDDFGRTWKLADTTLITSNRTGSVFGHVIDAGGGRLAVFGHRRPKGEPAGGIWMSLSNDRGASWGEAKDVLPGKGLVEPDFVCVRGGFVGLVRQNGVDGYWQVRLNEAGDLTDGPTLVLGDGVRGHGFPSPCLVADPKDPDRLYLLRSRRFTFFGNRPNDGEIDLWTASAKKLDWRRLGTVVTIRGVQDFGYPAFAPTKGGAWLAVFYAGKNKGNSDIYAVSVPQDRMRVK